MSTLKAYRPVYRRYLYLDGEEVLNGLSGILEGEEVERLETVVKDLGANAGVKFSFLGAGVDFGAKGQRQTRRELRFKATTHSRVAQFVRELEKREGIADLRQKDDLDDVLEGTLVRLRARLSVIGEGELVLPSPRRFLDRLLGWDPFTDAADKNVDALGHASRVAVVDFECTPAQHIALELSATSFVVERLEDFVGAVTIVGLVDWKCANGDQQVLVKRNAADGEHLVVVETGIPSTEIVIREPEKAPTRWHPIKRRQAGNNRTKPDAKPSTAPALPADALKAPNGTNVTLGVRPLMIFR